MAHTLPLSSLESLSLEGCPELLFQRDGLPSDLHELQISSCHQLPPQVDWSLQRLVSLTGFKLTGACQDMEPFPNESLLPSSLTCLSIKYIQNLKSLDCMGLQRLTSLTALYIFKCPEFQSFRGEELQHLTSPCPKFQSFGKEGLQHLTSLENLDMGSLPLLEFLREVGFQHLTPLKKLFISNCSQLQYLTKETLPNSLYSPTIKECPLLKHCCEFEKGQDWEYVSHIPCIVIDGVLY